MDVVPFPRPPPPPPQIEANTEGSVPPPAPTAQGESTDGGGRRSPPPIFSKIRMLDSYRSSLSHSRSRSHSVRRKPVRKSASDPSIPSLSSLHDSAQDSSEAAAASAAAATAAQDLSKSKTPPPARVAPKDKSALGRLDTHVPSPELDLEYFAQNSTRAGLDDSPPPAPQRRRPLPLPPYSAMDPAQPFPFAPGRMPSHLGHTAPGEETPRALRPVEPPASTPTPVLELDRLHIEYPFTDRPAEGGSTMGMIGSRSSGASSTTSAQSWFDALDKESRKVPPPSLPRPSVSAAATMPAATEAPVQKANDPEVFGQHPSHASSASIYSQLSEAGDYGTASEGSLTASYHTAASWASDETAAPAPAPPPPPSTPEGTIARSHLEGEKEGWAHGVMGMMPHYWRNDKARTG